MSHADHAIAELNRMAPADFERALLSCCGSSRWVAAMAKARPFADEQQLKIAARTAFDGLSNDDWLEAFAHHPRIGDLESLRSKFASTAAWASGEQASAASASEEVLLALQAENKIYAEKFGFIFIVFATGKSAAEMLELLRARLPNSRDEELIAASEEQEKITWLRLDKLLAGVAASPS